MDDCLILFMYFQFNNIRPVISALMFTVYMRRITNCNIWFLPIGASTNVVELFTSHIYLFSVREGDTGHHLSVFVSLYFDGYRLASVILASINNPCLSQIFRYICNEMFGHRFTFIECRLCDLIFFLVFVDVSINVDLILIV